MTKFLNVTPNSVFAAGEAPRFSTPAYNNYNFATLGELVGLKTPNAQATSLYERAMLLYWGLAALPNPRRYAHIWGTAGNIEAYEWANARALGAAPAHDTWPAYGVSERPGVFQPYQPYQYVGDFALAAGAGGWTISAIDVARFFSSMDPNSANRHLLTPDQVRLLHSPYSPEPSYPAVPDNQGLAFQYHPMPLNGEARAAVSYKRSSHPKS